MADLEELAVKRDRSYLVRLVLGLGAGAVVGAFVFLAVTGEDVGGCLARASRPTHARQP